MKSRPVVVYSAICLLLGKHVESAVMELQFSNDKVFKLEKIFAPCEGPRRTMYFTNVTVSGRDRNKLNYDLVVPKIIHPGEMVLQFTSCPSKEALASCSVLQTFRTKNFCKLMTFQNEIFSSMLACATPKWSCPFVKTVYRGRDCGVDMRKFTWFSLNWTYLKLKIFGFERKKEVLCAFFEGSLIRRG